MPGILYVVATPIGNLEDITLRALRLLKEADLIAAEDTRVTRKLLSHYDIHTPLTSYHQHTRGDKLDSLLQRLREDQTIALVSDAGMPGISDPGGDLIAAAIALGARVYTVPGPNAALSALVISGLPTDRFAFEGFAPRGTSERREFFENLRQERRTLLFYESPNRVQKTLEEIYRTFGERPVAIARELTKLFEEVFRGSLSEALLHLSARAPRGEYCLVVAGAPDAPPATEEETAQSLQAALHSAIADGLSSRDAIQQVADRLNLPRKFVYRTFLESGLKGGNRQKS